MHKNDIIFIHLTLFEIKSMLEKAGFKNDFFSIYNQLGVLPSDLHKNREMHEKAIIVLCYGILKIVQNTREIMLLLRANPIFEKYINKVKSVNPEEVVKSC